MSNKEKSFKSFSALAESISDAIGSVTTNESALGKVVQKRVDAEVERRSALLEKGFEKYTTAEKALKQCGPDVITHEIVAGENEGTPIKKLAFSDKRLKELQKLRKDVADLDAAFLKAYSEGNYENLQKLVGSGKPEEKKSDE
jgi:hypothetical protein